MPSLIQLDFTRARAGQSQNEKLRDYFLAFPSRWLPMPELACVITATGCGAAVHSRISDLRIKFNMPIQQRREGRNKSFYRYEPGPDQNTQTPKDPNTQN